MLPGNKRKVEKHPIEKEDFKISNESNNSNSSLFKIRYRKKNGINTRLYDWWWYLFNNSLQFSLEDIDVHPLHLIVEVTTLKFTSRQTARLASNKPIDGRQ